MDNLVLASLTAYSLIFSLGLVVHSASITSCNQTPYPQVCNYYLMSTNLSATHYSFRHLSLKVTMDQAIKAHSLLSTMNLSSFDKRAKLAWADCVELSEDTVNKINCSLSSNHLIDSGTWLSAAIADQETCKDGFIELNSNSYLQFLPKILGDLSKLLSNSLAINKAALLSSSKQVGGRHLLVNGFPTWVSIADQKLLQSTEEAPKADMVVAQDGSGDYKSISEAVIASRKQRNGSKSKRFVIYVKAGVYKENVVINSSMTNLMFVGDGTDATIVTAYRNNKDGSTTYASATFAVSGDGFIASKMTFENTAGPDKHQAVALLSSSDFSVFYNCSFKGYQDTLYVHSQRQFYRDCDIYGTVDFIFGDATAVLQNCNIYVRKPMSNQENTITAQSRKDRHEDTGIIIHKSRVMAASDLKPVKSLYKTYLGRPWREYSRTVFMKSYLDGIIDSEGWLRWNGNFALSTLYYGEYMNNGSGANTNGRVQWPGYHVLVNSAEAEKFTVKKFLAGETWIPATGVPYEPGL